MLNRRLFAIVLVAVSTACCSAKADEWLTDLDKARQIAQDQNRPFLVHFYADWCGPCKIMEKNVLHATPVSDAISREVIAVKVNITNHPELGERFGVESLPTDVFIEPTGKHIVKTVGQRTVKEYADSIVKASARYQANVASRTPRSATPAAGEKTDTAAARDAEPMLLGYCPVTLSARRKWEKGLPQFAHEFRGQTYMMSSSEALKDFKQNPARYAPQFLGCDPVLVQKEDRAVVGSTRYAAFYDEDLYLFTSDENRKAFKQSPDKFVRERVVLHLDDIEVVTK